MKITRCKYGHYYDKAYFRECPHCCRARGGRDEDIIIGKNELSQGRVNENEPTSQTKNEKQGENISQKEKDRKNVERWIGEAWDELEEILNEEDNSSSESVCEGKKAKEIEPKEKIKRQERKEAHKEGKQGISEKEKIEKIAKENNSSVKKQPKNFKGNRKGYMLFTAMPLKVIKNQEFCMDFCIFPEEEWEMGAKMLSFKSQESIRDLKPVQMALPERAVLHILYKEEEIFQKEIELEQEKRNVFCTFPVTVTDTRDRRFHMIKAVFEVKEQNIEIPLYLMPNP